MPSIDDPPFGTTPSQEQIWFDEWWQAYWLHKAKKAARQAFHKHVRTDARFGEVMAATRAQQAEMLSRDPLKRPHGATWLNGERWNDPTMEPAGQAPGGNPTAPRASYHREWKPPESEVPNA